MPPSSILPSMRYLPASTCPTRRSASPARLSTAPSAGQSVVVSAYSLPHVGQVFIEERAPPSTLFPGETRAYHTAFARRNAFVPQRTLHAESVTNSRFRVLQKRLLQTGLVLKSRR